MSENRGRPKIEDGKKENIVYVRLDNREHEYLTEYAEKTYRQKSQVLRLAFDEFIKAQTAQVNAQS